MIFNLKKTGIWQAVKAHKRPFFGYAGFLSKMFLTFGFILLIVFSAGVLFEKLSDSALDKLLGGSILALAFGFLFLEINLFFKNALKNPKLIYSLHDLLLRPNYINLASFLDLEAAHICLKTLQIAKKQSCKEPSSLHLMLALASSKSGFLDFVFNRAEIDKKQLKAFLQNNSKTTPELNRVKSHNDFKEIIFEAGRIAESQKRARIGLEHILTALGEKEPLFQDFLLRQDLKNQDIAELALWFQRIKTRAEKEKKFWLRENLSKRGSFGRDFAAGFTLGLDKYSVDLRQRIIKKGLREIIGHKEEIKRVEAILSKKEMNNALLVGMPGSGRKSVAEAVAQQAFLGRTSEELSHRRFLDFDPSLLTSQITSQEEAERALDNCLSEAVRAGNIVLVINNFENFAGSSEKPGTLNITAIISRYLPLSSFQIMAVTSYDGLHKILERNPALLNLFEKVEIAEMSPQETMRFLENYVPYFEAKHGRYITFKALREIVRLSSRYFSQSPLSEKAIRLLDEAISYLLTYTGEFILKPSHIQKIVSQKIEVPLGKVEAQEKSKLLDLEKLIHQRIINQEEAVKEISDALRRARAAVTTRKGPMGAFLFLGPTGVGKTETSKALSSIYFGSQKKMHRLDMSEFQNTEDISRLIGAYDRDGLLTLPVREEPFSLILLDEIEKAEPNILNLFLQVIDEGFITDGRGRKVDFRDAIIIATSNAGAEIIRQDIAEDKKMDIIKEDLMDYLFRKNIFRPEFINRFDKVVVFKPLTKTNLLDIVQLMLLKLAENLKDKGIYFEITPQLKQRIVELSYNPAFGAREMRRVIQQKVENLLAEALLSGKIKRGNRIKVADNFELQVL